ncbi:MAG: hypothetical protein NZM38_01465 [Cytophagales bacterium]|nr:hypothetical protein [Cytophagales bacterium]MDW8383419.1 hypothetical protein [Flammeovirgaceae bacterium]
MRNIIFFELNEVPFSIIDYYVKKYPSSTLARLLPIMAQYETISEDEGHLSPWITWPTVHRGVTNAKHRIKDFGEDLSKPDAEFPPIWKILKKNGISTGVFMSMHSYPIPDDYQEYSFYVPDPFAGDSRSHPENIIPFQKFNLAMSRKSGRNVDTSIDLKAASELAFALPSLGIKLGTLSQVAAQLVRERTKPWMKTRRRTYQSVLAFDIYLKLLKEKKPQFSTFFSNHCASSMHRYWAAAFPEQYEKYNLDKSWQTTYAGEIDFVMHKADDFLSALVNFVNQNPEYILVVASSMGQKATEAEEVKSETLCKDLSKWTSFLGLSPHEWEPRAAMHPQYNFQVKVREKVQLVKENLNQLYIAGKPLQYREKDGFFSLDLGHRNLPNNIAIYKGKEVKLEDFGVTNEAIDDATGSTAYHVPEGSLLIYDSQNKQPKKRIHGITTCAIAPSILENFHLPIPQYMITQRIPEIAHS